MKCKRRRSAFTQLCFSHHPSIILVDAPQLGLAVKDCWWGAKRQLNPSRWAAQAVC